ncbi:MAG: hypothetical protein A3F84_00205 [Candidatus Handelsmanbacteria bacterium RIFCSPLOWO2_12_FULL_64_10]|uniref:Uncharacterized protein n=1 Tax=Handelsmanbacteria sp. (strain RIFCSPLOWO2_12_FULL_64_10) TaxID=1817868 RepID=A0A1F6D6N2_HANXR|nr:MAG: hypothetical protein A3F84_00205 [Candidatus Handelsmanbacteria bacterium RIFCSPLOWO2_12_FULL_64_10]
MNEDQRKWLADGLKGIGNMATAALLFGSMVSDKPVKVWIIIIGVIVLLSCYGIGYTILKRMDKDGINGN